MRLLKKSNTSKKEEVSMFQIHSDTASVVSKINSGKVIKNCDGLVTNDPRISLRVSVADCIPLALFDPFTNSIGLVHAGWRGLDNKIIENTIKIMNKSFDVNPKNLIVEIGPHICPKHYEINTDVSSKFSSINNAVLKWRGKTCLDLSMIAKSQLEKCGVVKKNIAISKICTYENRSLASYRRGDRSKTNYFFLSLDTTL